MAKKVSNNETSLDIFTLVSKVDNSAEILSESKCAVIKDYIDTGSYILNACISGSLYKGVQSGRVCTLSGPAGAGKSFLALSICRNAQKKGYIPIYMDSEGAIDVEFVSRLGCDPNRFIIKQVTTIREVSTFMANILKGLLDVSEENRDKVIFVLDSLGNLTSDKEMTTTLDGSTTKDMTKQQEVKALFRTNATALSKADAPFVVCTHTYQTMDLFSKNVVSGGCVTPETVIISSDGNKMIKDIKVGDYVLDENGEYSEVLKIFNYKKPAIRFVFSDGTSIECSKDHKFKVQNADGQYIWKRAEELSESDYIIQLVREI